MRRFNRFNHDAPLWQQKLYWITSVALVLLVFGALAGKRSCAEHELGDEARQVATERCLKDDYSADRCAGFIDANHDYCIRGSIDYPGKYESHEPFLKPDRYYACVMLGKEGYRAWRRDVYKAESNNDSPPPLPLPGR